MSARGIHKRRLRGNFNRLLSSARLQDGVQSEYLVYIQDHISVNIFFKSLQGVFHVIYGRCYFNESVVTRVVRLRTAADIGGLIHQCDGHATHHGTRRVGNAADDSTPGALSEGAESQTKDGHYDAAENCKTAEFRERHRSVSRQSPRINFQNGWLCKKQTLL